MVNSIGGPTGLPEQQKGITSSDVHSVPGAPAEQAREKASPEKVRKTDEVVLSPLAKDVRHVQQALKDVPEVRKEKVDEIQSLLLGGGKLNEEKVISGLLKDRGIVDLR